MSASPEDPLLAACPVRTQGTTLHWRLDGEKRTPIVNHRPFGRYHQLSAGSAWVWQLCDGQRSIAAIADHIAARGGPADPARVVYSVRRLAAQRLIEGAGIDTQPGPPTSEAGTKGILAACRRTLTWRATIAPVDPAVTWLYRHAGFLAFTRPLKMVLVALMGAGFLVFAAMSLTAPPSFSALTGRGLWFLPLFFVGATILHETGHAMATKHFGREMIGVGFGWFWVGPFFYVDTSDLWLAGKRERVLVSLAGGISDLVFAGVCSLVALVAPVPVAGVALAMAASFYLIVLCNMSPLLEFDGYYALVDLLGRPNLRRRSLNHVLGAVRQRPVAWRTLWEDRVACAYAAASLANIPILLIVTAWVNHGFFTTLFRHTPGHWPVILTAGGTSVLLMVLLLGLVDDIRRLAPAPPSSIRK